MPDPVETVQFEPLKWLLSAMGGALITLVAFRTKISGMDRDIKDAQRECVEAKALARTLVAALEKTLDERAERLNERLDRLDRRSLEMMRLLADVARAVNVDQRYTDTVLRMLADDSAGGDSR